MRLPEDRPPADGDTLGDLPRNLRPYDRLIDLELANLAVDGCIIKAPCGGEKVRRSPVDRGKGGVKRSTVVDARGIPLGTVVAPANRTPLAALGRDPRCLGATWRTAGSSERASRACLSLGHHSPQAGGSLLGRRDLREGQVRPLGATKRWMVERTNSWSNAHKKLVWCTEREGRVIDFWIAFSNVVIVMGRLVREGWIRYRWEGRPSRKP